MINYIKKTYRGNKESFFKVLENNLINNNKMFIVTANPETFMKADSINEFDEALMKPDTTIVPDGIGVVKAANYIGINEIKERITGVDISYKLLELANKHKKTVYLFGASKKVIELTVKSINKEYPNVKILGYSDGYIENKDDVFEEIKNLSPDIVLVALGVPKQELLIYKHYNEFLKGIFVGVGGTFDVISGTTKRAPEIVQKLNIEWLYRIAGDKERIKRFYNSNIKFVTIFGTRPEAIKMAPLVKELEKREEIESVVCVTAQHRQMLDQVLETFNITPDYDLNIMKQGQTLVDITTRALQSLSEVISQVKPNIVLVHGDTTTTLSGSLAAFYNQVSVGHVEAGLRTYDKYSPFPEEVNRQVTGIIADMHFAPTEVSKNNLLKEGKKEETIYVTGNTAIDALRTTVKDDYYHPIFDKIGNDKIILLTAHRRENLGEPMKNMFRAIKRIVEEFDGVQVIYPVHLNPLVRQAADEVLGDNNKVHLIDPLEVLDFHNFLNKSYIIMTDSGGIQEEAPSLGKPVLVLRDTTERPEGVNAGTLRLAGTDEDDIYDLTKLLLTNKDEYNKMSKSSNPYGDGMSSKYIVDEIIKKFS